MKIKIKSHGNEVTDFYDKKVPKVDSNHICLVVISLDSVPKKDGNYGRQVFLKVIRHINDNFSDFSSDDHSDE